MHQYYKSAKKVNRFSMWQLECFANLGTFPIANNKSPVVFLIFK